MNLSWILFPDILQFPFSSVCLVSCSQAYQSLQRWKGLLPAWSSLMRKARDWLQADPEKELYSVRTDGLFSKARAAHGHLSTPVGINGC